MVDFADFCGRYIKSHYQLSDLKKKSPSFPYCSELYRENVEKILEGRKSRN